MVWTDEMEEKSVNMWKKERYLYDMKMSEYKDWKKEALTIQQFATFNFDGRLYFVQRDCILN